MSNYYEGIPFGSKIGRGRRRNRSLLPFVAGLLLVIALFSVLNSPLTTLWAGEEGEAQAAPSPTMLPVVVPIPTMTPTPRALPTVEPTAVPTPSPTPTPSRMQVANTGGIGVYVRANPSSDERIKAWLEGTEMVVIGDGTEIDGVSWLPVRDPAGNEGWVPAQYLVPATPQPEATPEA